MFRINRFSIEFLDETNIKETLHRHSFIEKVPRTLLVIFSVRSIRVNSNSLTPNYLFFFFFLDILNFAPMVMAGKDEKEEVVKEGFMVKRSQNKKRFTPVNYKQRWFVLTKNYLIYYDGDGDVSELIIIIID